MVGPDDGDEGDGERDPGPDDDDGDEEDENITQDVFSASVACVLTAK